MSRKGYWIPLCGLPTLRENKKKSSAAEDRIRCLTRKKIIVRRGGQRRKGDWIHLCSLPTLRENKKKKAFGANTGLPKSVRGKRY
jgi:hypothetical protein